MSNLNQELEAIQRLEKKTKTDRQKSGDRLQRLRKRIKAGETTGDRVKDFVIAQWGSLNEQLLSAYRTVEERLAQHVGGLVLFIVRTHVPLELSMLPTRSGGKYMISETWYLGVAKEPQLSLDHQAGTCAVVTGQYVKSPHPFQLVEGNIPPERSLEFPPMLEDYIEPTARMIDFGEAPRLRNELLVGDVEVEKWFEKKHQKDSVLCKASRLLGHPMEESEKFKVQREKLRQDSLGDLQRLMEDAFGAKRQQIEQTFKAAIDLDVKEEQLASLRELLEKAGIKIS